MKKILIAALIALVLFGFLAVATRPEKEDKGPLEKITFIHYKKGTHEANNSGKAKPGTSCYSFLSTGAKWKTTEPFAINPSNNDSVSETAVQNAVNAGVAEWEKSGGNIFGNGSIDYTASYNGGALDGINTVTFGDLGNQGIIAVTTIWGYFSGPTQSRELIEWDLQFNDYFQYGDATTTDYVMDVQNIATHELGHAAGMADLYTVSCNNETMYGYSSVGETQKRTLNIGDIKGIKLLYGA
ncbi:MAG: matrixin family metalloprotease [Candidatus Diapherotrites archaeon]|nr:matrixin family metalloprotease [Candidatus Diapherotrites archaeon]